MLYFDLTELLGEKPDRDMPVMKSIFSEEYVPFLEVEEKYIELFHELMSGI